MENSSNALDLLESVLDQAFVAPPRETLQPEISTPATQEETSAPTESAPIVASEESSQPTETATESTDESWKAEYEAQVQNWRAQSAEAREKAEKERLKWEAIRAIEREDAAKMAAAGIVDEPVMSASVTQSETWENVEEFSSTTTAGSSRVVEHVETEIHEQPATPSPDDNTPDKLVRTDSQLEIATNESQKWEDVPSVTSSFPSMTFPDHNETPPAHSQPAPQQPPVSVTLAIFDSSLSVRTRVTALLSSLAVNLFLPFVNGVMLGFGEIFAKNVVMQWFGWKPFGPAHSVANVGLRGTRDERQRQSK